VLLCTGVVEDLTSSSAAGHFNGRLPDLGGRAGAAAGPNEGSGGAGAQSLGAAPTLAQLERGHGVVAVYYRCLGLFAELWSLLQARAAGSSDALAARIRQLEPPLAALNCPLLAHMSSVMHPRRGARPSEQPLQSFAGTEALFGRGQGSDDMDTGSLGIELYPSETARLSMCLHLLQSWRYDTVSQAISASSDAAMLAGSGFTQDFRAGAAFAAAGPRYTPRLLAEVRSRASVLCLVFVHCCSEVLNVRFASTSSGADAHGTNPPLIYAGSRVQYSMLVTLVEVSLQQLYAHLAVLKVAADEGSCGPAAWASASSGAAGAALLAPAPSAAPRLALVVQSLRQLRQLASIAGGLLTPLEPDPQQSSSAQAGPGFAPAAKALDLNFAACFAERVEELVMELQSI